jgi:hypothetical protein
MDAYQAVNAYQTVDPMSNPWEATAHQVPSFCHAHRSNQVLLTGHHCSTHIPMADTPIHKPRSLFQGSTAETNTTCWAFWFAATPDPLSEGHILTYP